MRHRWQFAWAWLLGAVLAGCGGNVPPPQPPTPPPPEPQCTVTGEACGCWHMPPGNPWLYACCVPAAPGGVINVAGGPAHCPPEPEPPPATCPEECPAGTHCEGTSCVTDPTPPPSSGCNPQLDPSMLPPLDNDTDWSVVKGASATRTSEVNSAVAAAQAACPSAWKTTGALGCLTAGPSGIDDAFAQIAAELHAVGVKAGQPIREDDPTKRIDALSVNAKNSSDKWEEWHLFYYGNGCLIGGPYKGTWLYTGSGAPPPDNMGCGDPLPPPIARVQIKVWDIGGYNLDSVAKVKDAQYCAEVGFGSTVFCPVRPEPCDGPECIWKDREACEDYASRGDFEWLSDAPIEVKPDNKWRARYGPESTWVQLRVAGVLSNTLSRADGTLP